MCSKQILYANPQSNEWIPLLFREGTTNNLLKYGTLYNERNRKTIPTRKIFDLIESMDRRLIGNDYRLKIEVQKGEGDITIRIFSK